MENVEEKKPNPILEDKEIIAKVHNLMMTDKLHRNASLTLDSLAEKVGVTRNSLSRAINRKTGKNFNQYVNGFRIVEAIKLLTHTKNDSKTINSIASQVGFKSRSSFYESFKKNTGAWPTEFKKNKNKGKKNNIIKQSLL